MKRPSSPSSKQRRQNTAQARKLSSNVQAKRVEILDTATQHTTVCLLTLGASSVPTRANVKQTPKTLDRICVGIASIVLKKS